MKLNNLLKLIINNFIKSFIFVIVILFLSYSITYPVYYETKRFVYQTINIDHLYQIIISLQSEDVYKLLYLNELSCLFTVKSS